MTTLIGHHYNKDKGIFETFSIEVNETPKQFTRTSSCNRLDELREYWSVLHKSQLNKLRNVFRGYLMYSLQENMALFQKLIVADLEQRSVVKKFAYDESLELLGRAQKASERANSRNHTAQELTEPRQTEGSHCGHYWTWLSEYGLYICNDLPTQVCAETVEDLERAIRTRVNKILREQDMTLEEYMEERENVCRLCNNGSRSRPSDALTIWSCKKCGTMTCEHCFVERHGARAVQEMFTIREIFCPDCYDTKTKGAKSWE